MSFSDLKSARKSKSYVQSPSPNPISSSSADEPEQPQSEQLVINSLPDFLELLNNEISGRGLWAKQPIKAGSVLLANKVYAASLSSQLLDTYCSSCFARPEGTGLKKCTQCRLVHYCDATCQKNDWFVHKEECKALQKWQAMAPSTEVALPSDAVRCLSRLLWKRQKRGSDHPSTKEVNALHSHRRNLRPEAYELHTNLAHVLVQFLGATSPSDLVEFGISSAGDLLDIVSQFVTNTFSVTDASLSPLGASVSPPIALINHSCIPNAVVVFPRTSATPRQDEPRITVTALRDIEVGEEILTSYIDTTVPKSIRQKELLETYNFECKCSLCSAGPAEIDSREAAWCPKRCGGLCPLPTEENRISRCVKCNAVLSDTEAILDAIRVSQEGLDKATALQFTETDKSLRLTTNLIPLLESAGLPPSSHPLLALSRLHQSLLISSLPTPLTQEYLDDTIRASQRVQSGLMSVLPLGHPVLAMSLAELGKLLAVDEPDPQPQRTGYPPSGPARLKLAYDTLQLARRALLLGFGAANDGGQVGRDIRELIVRLEKEMDVWRQGVRNVIQDRRP